MIENISIENFRCFDKTEIKGFERINLITGKNNSGKTCLLEALYFALGQNFMETLKIRYNEDEWKQDDYLMNNDDKGYINFRYNRNNEKMGFRFTPMPPQFTDYETGKDFMNFNDVKFLGSTNDKSLNYHSLVKLFDQAQIGGFDKEILEAVKLIDNKISEIRTFASFPNTLFLKTINSNKYQPINYYGDAIKKIILYIGVIFSFDKNKNKYLLIDEIENGIHFTAQLDIWAMLFVLCKRFDVQLFATTHSYEMIKTFEAISSTKEYEGEGAYFEMARHAKTNQIIGIKHEIATLEYELETNTAIRGE